MYIKPLNSHILLVYCFVTQKGPTWSHGHKWLGTQAATQKADPPQLDGAQAPWPCLQRLYTHVWVLSQEEGPVLLTFSTQRGVYLKKGLELVPVDLMNRYT